MALPERAGHPLRRIPILREIMLSPNRQIRPCKTITMHPARDHSRIIMGHLPRIIRLTIIRSRLHLVIITILNIIMSISRL